MVAQQIVRGRQEVLKIDDAVRPFPLSIRRDRLACHAQQPTADGRGFLHRLRRRLEAVKLPTFQFRAQFLKGRLDRLIYRRIGPRLLANGAHLGKFMKLRDGRREIGAFGQPRQFRQKTMHIIRHHAGHGRRAAQQIQAARNVRTGALSKWAI